MFNGIFLPEMLCRYRKLSPGAKMIWGRLARYAGANGNAHPSMKSLGDECGMSERQARRHVHELKHQGFLDVEFVDGSVSRFFFLWHEVFEEPRTHMAGVPRTETSAPPRTYMSAEESQLKESHSEESQIKSDFCPSIAKSSDEQAVLAPVRSILAEFMECAEAEIPAHIPSEVLREAQAPAAEVVEYLRLKKPRYGPGTRHAPREWAWFMVVVRAEFTRRREAAEAHAKKPVAHWSDPEYRQTDQLPDWSAIELPHADPPPEPKPHHMEHGGAALRRIASGR